MLRFSSKAEYGLLLVHYLRNNQGVKYSISDVSNNLSIPALVVRKLTSDLAKAGILKVFHGRNGGIMANDMSVSVYDVLCALGEEPALVPCLHGKECGANSGCEMSTLFYKLNNSIGSIMKLTKL